jgi:hypothetical protein
LVRVVVGIGLAKAGRVKQFPVRPAIPAVRPQT